MRITTVRKMEKALSDFFAKKDFVEKANYIDELDEPWASVKDILEHLAERQHIINSLIDKYGNGEQGTLIDYNLQKERLDEVERLIKYFKQFVKEKKE